MLRLLLILAAIAVASLPKVLVIEMVTGENVVFGDNGIVNDSNLFLLTMLACIVLPISFLWMAAHKTTHD